MTIKYAILGYLSWRPLSGYDLKKIFMGSATLYWSGNNNQIYRALVELHDEGLVTIEVQHQEHLPSRKVYTITGQGQAALREWVLSSPELPQFRNTFLIQLSWADRLAPAELDGLLAAYEHALDVQLLTLREQERRGEAARPARTPREGYLWDMIAENYLAAYENELSWVRRLRTGLQQSQGFSPPGRI